MSRQDLDHLNVLAILHYVLAGLSALFSLLPLLYVVLGFAILAQGGPGAQVGLFFVIVFGIIAAYFVLSAILSLVGGIYLHRRKGRTFCFIAAAISCVHVPLGTVLGIFTILVLSRESVKELFAGRGRYHDPEDEDHPPPYDDRDRPGWRDDRDDWRGDWRRDEPGHYGRDSDHDH